MDTHDLSRLRSLDALRGVAILLVVGRHIYPEHPWFKYWIRGGWTGVDLFFVLSGFLVGGLAFSEYKLRGSLDGWRFFIRRQFKIYPSLVFLTWVTAFVRYIWAHEPVLTKMARDLLFVQNYTLGLSPHTWSLAVEEHFYFGLGVVTLICLRFRKKSPMTAVAALYPVIALFLLALRFWNQSRHPYDHLTHLFPTHLRFDTLWFGVLLGWLYQFHFEKLRSVCERWSDALIALGICLILPAFLWDVSTPWVHSTVGFLIFGWASGALLLGVLFSRRSTGKWGRTLAFVGRHSYGIYLWHYPLQQWLPRLWKKIGFPLGPLGTIAAYFLVSIGVGVLATRWIERPFLRWRDRLLPSLSRRTFLEPSAPQVLR